MKPFFQRFSHKGLICAHRGARSIAPENTMFALEQARLCGADLWETDVQLTADGELVLFHDDSLERTTNISLCPQYGGRKNNRISQFFWTELQLLNAGNWFVENDPYATIISGEVTAQDLQAICRQKIPSCREALEYCRQHQFPINLEIKDQKDAVLGTITVEKVMDLLVATDTTELVLISSFNHDYLRYIRQNNKSLATAALVETSHPDGLIDYLKDLGCDAYHPHWSVADAHLIHELNVHGIEVNVWTVNSKVEAEKFKELGVFFICTDWPQRML